MQNYCNDYPEDWEEISELVKSEGGWVCVRCGHPDNPDVCRALGVRRGHLPCTDKCSHPKNDKQRVLTVHHLDGDKSNCAWWNLASLCQACHLRIQGKVIMERPYMFPHSEWFLPYIGGYYAKQSGWVSTKSYFLSLELLPREYVTEHINELLPIVGG